MLELEIESALGGEQGRPWIRRLSIGAPGTGLGASRSTQPTPPRASRRSHAPVTGRGSASDPVRAGRAGRAGLLALLCVALVGGVVALAFLLSRDPSPGAAVARPGSRAGPEETPPEHRGVAETELRARAEPRAASTPAVAKDLRLGPGEARPARDDGRFQGRGRIRGFVDTADDSPFPASWTLVLEPSLTLAGRERAQPRVIEFAAGEQEFVVDDLPLAGYDVLATAPGWNARRHPVLLDRRHDNPYITLQLHAAGWIEGRVLDHAGLPAEGLPVGLRPLAGDEPTRESACDVLSRYRFDDVLDGEYELRFGAAEKPLLPLQRLRFSAPSMTIPDRELPETSRIALLVLDEFGVPVSDARVRGGGDGGAVDATTDGAGRAEARWLRPGRYRLSAEHELHRRARTAFELTLEPQDVVLRFPPRR